MSEYRTLNLRVASHDLRNATFEGRDHLIVPVVALVEGVLHAANAKHPELALASEFSKAVFGWNGEPVVMNHPQLESGEWVSANSPEILEKYQIGRIFNSRVENNQLHMDAYIDLTKVDNVGEKAQKAIAKIREENTIEVSVGAFITSDDTPGVYKGRPYSRVWKDIVPDHLAFLEFGQVGACSNEAGCGFRAAMHVVNAEGFTLEGVKPVKEKNLLERLKDIIKGEEVEPVVDPPVAPAEPVAAAAGGCGCGGHKNEEPVVSAESAEGGKVHKNAERITALIANSKSPWTEHDRNHLESKTDEQLAAIESFGKESESTPEPVAAAAAKVELKLEDLPAVWQRVIRTAEANEQATRAFIVQRLTAAQSAFTKEDLDAMPYENLEKLSKAILRGTESVDFSVAAGAPQPKPAESEQFAAPPPDLGAKIRAARGIQ